MSTTSTSGTTSKRTVLITGCSSGFGRLAVETFARQGWHVVATMRRPERSPTFTDGDAVFVTHLDVTEPVSITQAISAGIDRFGRIDAVVNNAGIGGRGIFEQWPEDGIRALFETNVFGTMNVCRAVLPHLRRQGEGHIVNVTSIAGAVAVPCGSMYSATKFALQGFTEGLAADYGPLGISVRSVLPGNYPTAFASAAADHLSRGAEELRSLAAGFQTTIDRLTDRDAQDPQDVADLIVACCTDDSLPTHNPCGADAVQLFKAIEEHPREVFLEGMRALLAPADG